MPGHHKPVVFWGGCQITTRLWYIRGMPDHHKPVGRRGGGVPDVWGGAKSPQACCVSMGCQITTNL
jgi:hypothetical protein